MSVFSFGGETLKEPLYVFDNKDNLLAVVQDYFHAYFEATTRESVELDISLPLDHPEGHHFTGGNQVAFKDLDRNLRLFTIREPADEDGSTTEKRVLCLPAIEELTDAIVEERAPSNRTAEYTINLVLQNTRWKVGNTAELGTNSTHFYYLSVLESLHKIRDVWGGELI